MSVLHAGAPAALWSSPLLDAQPAPRRGDREMLFHGSLKHKQLNPDGLFSWEAAEHVLEREPGGGLVFAATDPDECNIRVYLSDVVEVASFGGTACRFDLVLRNKRTHSFLAPSREFCQAWVEHLTDCLDLVDHVPGGPETGDDESADGRPVASPRGRASSPRSPRGRASPSRSPRSPRSPRSSGSSRGRGPSAAGPGPSPPGGRGASPRERSASPRGHGAVHAVDESINVETLDGTWAEEASLFSRPGPRESILGGRALPREEGEGDRSAYAAEYLGEREDLDPASRKKRVVKKKPKKRATTTRPTATRRAHGLRSSRSVSRATNSSMAKRRDDSDVRARSTSPRTALRARRQGTAPAAAGGKTTRKAGGPVPGLTSRRLIRVPGPASPPGPRRKKVPVRRRKPGGPQDEALSARSPRSDLAVLCRQQAEEIGALRRQLELARAAHQGGGPSPSMQSLLLEVDDLRAELAAVRAQRDSMERILDRLSDEHARLKSARGAHSPSP